MMEGRIARMKAEIGKPLTVIATGGLAALFQEQAHLFDRAVDDFREEFARQGRAVDIGDIGAQHQCRGAIAE